jgi:hypothetical protein
MEQPAQSLSHPGDCRIELFHITLRNRAGWLLPDEPPTTVVRVHPHQPTHERIPLPCTRSARPPRTCLPRITNITKEASSARCCLPFEWLTAMPGMSPRARGCNPRRDLLGRILSVVQRSQPTRSGVPQRAGSPVLCSYLSQCERGFRGEVVVIAAG